MELRDACISLEDLTGSAYIDAACAARTFLSGRDAGEATSLAREKVSLCPPAFARRLDELLPRVGTKVTDGLASSARGAAIRSVRAASSTAPAPLAGLGFFRVGEDGRLYLTAKAEHYHLSLGHAFPGYRLLDKARALGIPNSTHNNTRGHVTRLLEEELVAAANGISRTGGRELERLLSSEDPRTINRVINLETGSLVVEAAVKMVLSRFYRFQRSQDEPPYAGRTPVILVVGAEDGDPGANYHGTTFLTQLMRGLWPEPAARLEAGGTFIVKPVRLNDSADFRMVLERWDRGPTKVAAFIHEIVLMNYGAVRLEEQYLRDAYALCREHDVPVVADEIQSCTWSPELFLFREYGLSPDLVAVGKGFPGGEYPAARVLATPALDTLEQFGALVTNGQEEIASLAFLVTIAFIRANADFVRDVGEHYQAGLRTLATRHAEAIERIEGRRHLAALHFRDSGKLVQFVAALNRAGIDASAQTYKAKSPPSCLTKLPLITTPHAVEFLLGKMEDALAGL